MNKDYLDFLETKQKTIIESGFDVDVSELNNMLFDFQKFTVKRALKKGKYAIFADTGQGKTPMQLEIASQVVKKTKKPALIICPLAVVGQTIKQAKKFNIKVSRITEVVNSEIYITNYDQLSNIDCSVFSCVCLDESSILKNESGKFRNLLIDTFLKTPYKFCFSATPSPNDPMELGNHSQFLDVMSYNEMLAMYFIHDAQQTQKWRLKGHAVDKFYEFVSSWAIMFSHPRDIGFEIDGYDLPPLKIIEKQIKTKAPNGMLFSESTVSATEYNKTLRETERERISETLRIVKSIPQDESIIIWAKQNEESKNIYKKLIDLGYDCRNVQGSDSNEKKENDLLGFGENEYKILITKQSIASQGLNYQNCSHQIFNSIDFSFEQSYQAMRRSWRYGQKKEVKCYMVTTDRMINVAQVQKRKQKEFSKMQSEMTKAVNKNLNNKILLTMSTTNDVKNENYWLMHGDCVQRIKEVPDNSVDLMVFSPPFADLYTYSNHIEDMGNVKNYDEFFTQFKFLIKELKRVIKPGRIIAVHCMELPTLKGRDGYMGLKRFPDKIADAFEDLDMFLCSHFTIWKDPLLAAVRTKTLGLAHKQLMKDSSMIRCGIADEVLCFKTKEENETPISHDLFDYYVPMHEFDQFPKSIEGFNEFWGFNPESKYSIKEQYSHHVWQRYASPVWLDIQQTKVLQYTTARNENDEKHICPLQLEVIERIIKLYSKEGETVLSPFGGIGSEGFQAIKMGRKSISIELKESYYNINKKNHGYALQEKGQLTLF